MAPESFDDGETAWVVTFVATVVLDVALGLLVGIVFALYFVIRNTQKPFSCILGRYPGSNNYKDIKTNRMVVEIPGIKIFRFENSLFFANAEQFRERLYEITGLNPKKLKNKKQRALYKALLQRKREQELAEIEANAFTKAKTKREKQDVKRKKETMGIEIEEELPDELEDEQQKVLSQQKHQIVELFSKAWIPPIHTLIIDCSVMNYCDSVAVRVLTQIINDFKEVGIKVFLAGCRDDTRSLMRKSDFYRSCEYNCLYYTVHEAVVISQEIHSHIVERNPKFIEIARKVFGDDTLAQVRINMEEPEGTKPEVTKPEAVTTQV